MHKYYVLSDYALWFLNPFLRIAILVYLTRYRIAPKLVSFRLYHCLVILADIYMFLVALFLPSKIYWHSYWILLSIFYLFHTHIAVRFMNLLVVARPLAKSVVSWAAYIMLTALIAQTMGVLEWKHWIPISIWADLLVWFILLICFVLVQRWTWPYNGLAAGLGVSVVLHVVAVALQGSQQPSQGIRMMYQMSYTVGLLIWLNTVRQNSRLKAMRGAN